VDLFTMERTFTGPMGSVVKYAIAFMRFIPYLFRRYDVLHVHFFYPFILWARAYVFFHRRTRTVATFHGADIAVHIRSATARALFSRIARRTDCLISVSHDLSGVIREKLGVTPHRVLCAGIDARVFFPEPDTEKTYDFIFAGSFTHRKGADLVVEAVRGMSRPGLRLCAAGTGPYIDALRGLEGTCRIDVLERQDQQSLRHLFNRSHFLLLPSRREPFGLVVSEAMYCGTPVVVSRSGGIVEQVRDGYNGLFIDDLSAEGLRRTLERALSMPDDEYDAMARHALASNKAFSLETACRETANIYRDLAGQGAPAPQRPPATDAENRHP